MASYRLPRKPGSSEARPRTTGGAERIADLLLAMADEVRAQGDTRTLGSKLLKPAQVAAVMYAQRRERERVFGDKLFGEPAWDMMLELYVSAKQGGALSTKAVIAGSAVPPTTALRWLENMEREGIIRRFSDPGDKRRVCVALTASTHAGMTTYLNETISLLQVE